MLVCGWVYLFIYIASSHPDRNSNYQFPFEGNVNPIGAARLRKNKTFWFFDCATNPLNPEIWTRSRYVLTTVCRQYRIGYRDSYNIYTQLNRYGRPSSCHRISCLAANRNTQNPPPPPTPRNFRLGDLRGYIITISPPTPNEIIAPRPNYIYIYCNKWAPKLFYKTV